MHKRNTLDFLGLWDQINNPGFNPVEFDGIKMETGLNRFVDTASARPKGAVAHPCAGFLDRFSDAASTRPKGAIHASPGQRPGNQSPTKFEALKGRSNRCPDPSPAPIHTACSAPETYHMNRAPQAPKARPEESDPSTTRGPRVRPNGRTVEPGLQPSRICETVTQGVALGWFKDGALPLRKTPIAALNAESAEARGNIKRSLSGAEGALL